nr:hypothetical protein [Atribacterota bacterium]
INTIGGGKLYIETILTQPDTRHTANLSLRGAKRRGSLIIQVDLNRNYLKTKSKKFLTKTVLR